MLRASGAEYEKVNYYDEPLGEEQLRELAGKLGVRPRELLRTGEAVYRELGLGTGEHTDDELIAHMARHPDLIQRPIVVRGRRAVLGRPVENVRELLDLG